jgi:hypothetical protein
MSASAERRSLRRGGVAALLVAFALPAAAPAAAAPAATRFCGEQRLFGYIRSLTHAGDHYVLRFDPALFLSGETANQAAWRDGAVPKGQPVPNDNYVVNESRRTYRYVVTGATRVRVLLQDSNVSSPDVVSVRTLAELVHGRRPVKLFEPLDSGVWLGVHIDRACSLDQQYRP